jgi:pantoate--beta-alanine ligase
MGALHAGHASLVDRAAAGADEVVVTVFVNPLQFAAHEDLEVYPRDLDGDAALAADHGATMVFAPSESEMYPEGRDRVLTSVAVPSLSDSLEGAARPTHFDGVCTVVAKLFNILGPCSAYFGEKDFQQLTIIRRMVRDLSFPVDVVACPTVREPDGVAMSSRNAYLSSTERAEAPVLHRALRAGVAAYVDGERSADRLCDAMVDVVSESSVASLEYADVVDSITLERGVVADTSRLVIAARFGSTRLLDNVSVLDIGGNA